MITSLTIFDLFLSYKNRPFIFVEPGENYGGLLIWKGAQKLADLTGIKYQSISHQEFMKANYAEEYVIYIHGGGGANLLWPKSGVINSFLKALENHRGMIMLGPQTFQDVTKTLSIGINDILRTTKASKVFVFARERARIL